MKDEAGVCFTPGAWFYIRPIIALVTHTLRKPPVFGMDYVFC